MAMATGVGGVRARVCGGAGASGSGSGRCAVRRWRLGNVRVAPGERGRAEADLAGLAAEALGVDASRVGDVRVVRRSFDARPEREGRRGGRGGGGGAYVYVMDVSADAATAKGRGRKKGVQVAEAVPEPEPRLAVRLDADAEADLAAGLAAGLGGGVSWEARAGRAEPPRVTVVGSGPAGLFAALALASHGVRVVLLERGQPVERRGRDIGALYARRALDGNSNLCYGEGGAGTWSDGKLTTRIGRNSGEVRQVLEVLHRFGAPADILVSGKPHLGTDRMVRILRALRAYLIDALGCEVRFGVEVTDIEVRDGACVGVRARRVAPREGEGEGSGEGGVDLVEGDAVVLAVGHSSRGMYERLHARGVAMEAKDFAVGFRVEHPQRLINEVQYGSALAGQMGKHGDGPVPVADYRLAAEAGGGGGPGEPPRSVYSFCMCPGGQIVPTSTNPEELCINGMSFSKRAGKFANSALVVTVGAKEFAADGAASGRGVLAGIDFQRAMEREAAVLGGGNLVVPVQTVPDFLDGRPTRSTPESSYRLGVTGTQLHELYPDAITRALRESLLRFERTMPGFASQHAVLHGVETRTSSPVRILRDRETLESPTASRLYPAGEGAGWAGGIVSAAVDGVNVARAFLVAEGLV